MKRRVKQIAGESKIKSLAEEIKIEKKDELKNEEKLLNEQEKEQIKEEKEEEQIKEIINKLYENEFDTVIIDAIKGKKNMMKFKIDEHNAIASMIVDKYILVSKSYLSNKQITEKESKKYAEYRSVVNNIKEITRPSQVDKLLSIKLSDKEQQILSYYETNDRREILNILNNELFATAKKLTKTIYYPKDNSVDILVFEDLFKDNVEDANVFFNMVKDQFEIKQSTYDEKIKRIIESKLVIPIVSDMMLYDNPNEVYVVDKSHKVKKESEEKVYYIVNKINEAIKKLESNDNSFIIDSLKYKNAIYYNSQENENIINDNLFTTNQMLKSQLQFLIDHKQNPFINLKSQYYFNYVFNNTLTAIRYVSIQQKNNNFISKKQNVQIRTDANNSFNIVGFMVIDKDVDNVIYDDLEEITYNKFLDCVYDKIDGKKFNGGYWLFKEDDKKRIENFNENMENVNMCKALTEQLFDDVNKIHNDILIEKIKKSKDYDEVLETIKKFVNMFYSNQINNDSPNQDIFTKNENDLTFYDEKIMQVENGIFKFLNDNNKDLENKFDKLYGYEESIKLTEPKYLKDDKIINIDLTNEKYIEDNTIDEFEGLTCQHHITWNDINNSFYHKNSNYQSLLNAFVSKYVEQDVHGKYVCKSCGEAVEITDYVQELEKSEGKLIITNSIAVGRIEDDKRYKEYSGVDGVINGIKSNIIKVADFVNIPQYAIKSKKTENDINQMTKDTIDLITNTLQIWNNKYLDYNKIKEEKYGINRVLSDLFIWPFDNNLYNNDTKYRDINKVNKQNNAIIYVAINLINSLSKDQIINLTKTRDCNYSIYEALSKYLTNCKIQITKDQTGNITNYPVLGYSIFNFAYNLVRYNRYIDVKGREKNSKLITELVLRAIYTIIDIMNVINLIYFEIRDNNESSEIFTFYQRYYLNFLNHLNNIYSDKSFISSLRYDKNKNLDKTEYEDNSIAVSMKYEDYFDTCKSIRMIDRQEYFSQFNVSVSNKAKSKDKLQYGEIKFDRSICCPDGKMHNWKSFEKGIKCSNCDMEYDELNKSSSYKSNLIDNINNEFLQELAKRYCPDAKKHAFELKNGKRICSLCGYVDGERCSVDKLKKLKDNFYKTTIIRDEKDKEETKINIIDDIELLNKEFKIFKESLSKDFDTISDSGVDINIDDITYTVNHTYNGSPIEPYIIKKEQVLKTELNNKEVLYYKDKNVNVFYDAKTLQLIGHKSSNNQFTKYTGFIRHKLIVNDDIKSFIENLFIPKNIINIIYLSKEDVFNTYYANVCDFMNNLVKVINKINNIDKDIKPEKIIDFDSYIANKNNILNLIASTYNGDKKFMFNNQFQEVLRNAYESIDKKYKAKILEDDNVDAYENSIKMFKECGFIVFKTFSLIILMKAINELIKIDRKITKQIVKLLIYTYISNYHLTKTSEFAQHIDIIYSENYAYGELINYEVDEESEDEKEESDVEDMDVDKFRDVDEDGNVIDNDEEDESNIAEIDD